MKVFLATYQSVMMLKGGPRTQVLETKAALEKLGVEVHLFDMWQTLKKGDCDIFHIFGSGIATYHFAREVAKLGIKLVVSPIFFSRHSSQYIKRVLWFDKTVLKKIRGVWTDYGFVSEMCKWVDAVLPNTKKEAELIELGLGVQREKIHVVPNGVNERFLNADPSLFVKTYGISNFILNVGHIGPGRKNVLRLVRALNLIDKPAVIIGRMEAGKELDAIRKEAGKKILLLDNILNDSDLLASAYAACDVFVLPSLFETPGIAALEAGLAGAKIVITKYGGTEEYFGDYAEYIEPTSVDSIAEGIRKAIARPKDARLRELIKDSYLWSKVGEATLEVYRKL
ncbi:MAG: glycosyltransferase family 4 protein [Bacteroidota bacterium]|nr:glycosyltransferase family 4 protein [Bacteroidota bacterium]